MANLSTIESMIENAAEAEDIAASEIDDRARQRWLEVAASWRVLAERELANTLGGPTPFQ
jgi:hypothetical protein